MSYYNSDGSVMNDQQQAGWESSIRAQSARDTNKGQYEALVKANQARAVAPVNAQETEDIAAANTQQSGVLNSAALAGSRRRAGGTTFRRRGSAVSANELVSGLGTANAKAIAQQRRAQALRTPQTVAGAAGGGSAPQLIQLW